MDRVLGWYSPGDEPIVRAQLGDPEGLTDATSWHENHHYVLTTASSHGIAQILLARAEERLAGQPRRKVRELRGELSRGAMLTQEGLATSAELLLLYDRGGEAAVEDRLSTLPAEYHLALSMYSGVVDALYDAGASDLIAQCVVHAVAQSCMRTAILARVKDSGLVDDVVMTFLADPRNVPDDRLRMIAALPRSDHDELARDIALTVDSFLSIPDADPLTFPPLVDRAVEAWIHRKGMFTVSGGPPPAGRWDLPRQVEIATANALGIDAGLDKWIIGVPFGEEIVVTHSFDLSNSPIYALRSLDHLAQWIERMRDVASTNGLLSHFAAALVQPARLSDEPYELFVTAIFSDPSEDTDLVCWVSKPTESLHAAVGIQVADSHLAIRDIPILLDRKLLGVADGRIPPFDDSLELFMCVDREAVETIRKARAEGTYETIVAGPAWPRMIVLRPSGDPIRYVVFGSPTGVARIAAELGESGYAMTGESGGSGIPLYLFLGIWHRLFGVFSNRPEPQ